MAAYEADAINWSYAHAGGVTTNTYLFTNPTLKLGLTNTIDAELNIVPAERVFTKSAFGKSSIGGAGDLFLRTKFNLAGPEGGDFQLTALPFVKLPTAKPGIGNKAVEGSLIVPVSFGLPSDFTLLFDPEIDVLRKALNTGRHANLATLANLSGPCRAGSPAMSSCSAASTTIPPGRSSRLRSISPSHGSSGTKFPICNSISALMSG